MEKEVKIDSVYDFSEVEKHIQEDIANKTIPSVGLAISKNGKIIYEKAFGYSDIENLVESTVHTSYQLASASKPMTATGIMLLHQNTDFDINHSIEDYMAPLRFKTNDKTFTNVKVVDVLNHTSGLGTYMNIHYSDEQNSFQTFESAFTKYGSLFHPSGLICEYSNLGYGLLDYVIEKQSKKSFSDFMKENLFGPLEMHNTFIDSSENLGKSIAKKYNSQLKVLPETKNNTKGAGNIYASVHDLILFGIFSLNKNNSLLDSSLLDLMHNYKNENALYHYYDSSHYGLGWYCKQNDDGYKIVWHEGGMMGASSIIKLIPEENISIAVVLNVFNQQYCQDVANQLSKIVLPHYNPSMFNEIAEYQHYTSDPSFFGTWKGLMKVEEKEIPCTLYIHSNGEIVMEYLDYTYKSYFTQNNPIFNKTYLMSGMVNQNYFIGTFPGDLPSKDIRHEFSQFLSLKLYKQENNLTGTIVALAAADREYYAFPFYIKLEKE